MNGARQYGVLPDHEIRRLRLTDPYREHRLQPASIDLLLSNEFRVYDHGQTVAVDLADPATYQGITRLVRHARFVLHPGEFILATTQERVIVPNDIMARVEGKSSIGRLGLVVHATAGFIDPGFTGEITLECSNLSPVPIVLHVGLPICQVSFAYMTSAVERPYCGKYQGQRGVTESRYAA
jgi:dCTP deaminase